jgi:nicotinamide-nucleotide amidase
VRCEVVAIGTELLLGQIVDTNSSWIGEQLALSGIDCHWHTRVGDNHRRMVDVLRLALDRNDAVIVCGGLGPTQDDITREAIAEVMGVELETDHVVLDRIVSMFGSRGREMAASNARQADVPVGAAVMDRQPGTAPGLICPVTVDGTAKVIYAVPGVPYEMTELVSCCVMPDLRARAGVSSVILSRTLRTWGMAESTLAEVLAPRVDSLEAAGNPTIAFLASGIEGIKVRITAKAPTEAAAAQLIDAEEAEVRVVLGDLVFGVDDETMEHSVQHLLAQRRLTLGIAESLTGGLIGARFTAVPGASAVFRGSLVTYSSEVKRDLLDLGPGPVVSEEAAMAMAAAARTMLGADVGIAATGVAGPEPQEGQKPGTVWFGIDMGALGDGEPEATLVRLPGDRDRVRQFAAISLLALLRQKLLASP